MSHSPATQTIIYHAAATAGGDIDLHIEASSAEKSALPIELQFLVDVKDRIGEQRIDVIVRAPGYKPKAIDRIAVQTGIVLERQ